MRLLQAPAHKRRPPPTGSKPRIVLVERDPYLAFLIRLHAPEADVVELETNVGAGDVLALHPDLVVCGIESGPFALSELLTSDHRPKVLAVVDGARAARSAIPSAVDGVVARPFAPADLSRAVRGALGLGPREEDEGSAGPTLARARSLIPPLRIAALAVVAVFEISASPEVSRARAYILASAFVYASLRWIWRRPSIVADTADIGVALALIAATGGVSSNYLPFGLISAGGYGLSRGRRWGFIGGLVIVAGSMPDVVGEMNRGLIDGSDAAAWIALYPMMGLLGGFAASVWHQPAYEGLNVLVEANRVLSSLYRIARTLPGGLEIGSVAEAAMHELRDALGSRAGAMLLSDAGTFLVVGSFGLNDPTGVMVRDPGSGLGAAIYGEPRVLNRGDLHPTTAEALGDHEYWLSAPMRHDGISLGLLIAASPSPRDADLLLLRRLADEATVAVENARLFSRVREISIDEERRRLARDLHDGIAQSLTHLRYELDFMARHGQAPEAVRRDVQRLGRVVERTSNDVRSMILGLRASISDEGLAGSLRSYLSDLQRLGGPEILFDARGDVRLPNDVEAEIFRVGQEAVSNALRHAQAARVSVRLESGRTSVKLIVEDDGVGVDPKRRPRSGGGVGMEAMRERAELIGADLTIGPRSPHGTRLVLAYSIGGTP